MKPHEAALSRKFLQSVLDYNEHDGLLRWKVDRQGHTRKGDVAGSSSKKGYVYVGIQQKRYLAHRLIWFYVHGSWPPQQIDHINGVKDDNRLSNLRLATGSQNQANTSKQRNNTTGFKGVVFHKPRNKFRAEISYQGTSINLGLFDTAEEAYKAYFDKSKELYGEFANST